MGVPQTQIDVATTVIRNPASKTRSSELSVQIETTLHSHSVYSYVNALPAGTSAEVIAKLCLCR
jgi:hypothetical protein